MLHVENDRSIRNHGVTFHNSNIVVMDYCSRNRLHLSESNFFPQTSPRSRIEREELVRWLMFDCSSVRYPSLWLELQAILSPHKFHPPHRIQREKYFHFRVNTVPRGQCVHVSGLFVLDWNWWVKPQ
ncbi:hypothetical protein CsSME_00002833 [Camellia sinensis var. sinensis]